MKVGENGEAFFVMKIDQACDSVPDSLVTSPMVSPTTEEPSDDKPHEPEPLDLGASQASLQMFRTPIGGSDTASDTTIDAPDTTTEADSSLQAAAIDVPPTTDASELDLDMDGYKMTELRKEEALEQGQRFASEMPLNRRHGGNIVLPLSERLSGMQLRWQHQWLDHITPSKVDTPQRPRRSSDASIVTIQTDEPSEETRPHLPVSLSDTELLRMQHYKEDEGRPSTQSAFVEEGDTVEQQQDEDEDAVGTLSCADADPYLFQLKLDADTVYTFELSLCSPSPLSSNEGDDSEMETLFDEGRVSFQRFMEDDTIIQDPRLCLRRNDKYHWPEKDTDMFSTLTLYRNALLRSSNTMATNGLKASLWRRWWGTKPPAPTARHSMDPTTSLVLPSPTSTSSHAASSESEPPTPKSAPAETYVKTLRLSSDQLKQLNLLKGMNTITFSVTSSYSGVATCQARIFLWDSEKPVVVSDIDGTITKSDALGHVFTLMGRDWTHLGVAKLYHDIAQNGYRIMYLTSRAIGQADITRDYLKNINQNNYQLPDGPVIMSPDRLIASLHREVILRKPEVFKMACLRDISRLFGIDPSHPVGDQTTPFYAGFGNRITDALSYRSVNIPSSRIFTIDANGEVKMELLELAGYNTSYPNMTDLVDQMFPPVRDMKRNPKTAAFSDFNYWRDDPIDVELPPDSELVSVVQPTSPSLRGLRSPKATPQASLDVPAAPSPGTEKPSRFRRLLGLRRRDKSTSSAAMPIQEEKSATSPSLLAHSFDASDGSMSPNSLLSQSPSSPTMGRQILYSDEPLSLEENDKQGNLEDEDMDESALSPEARRRLERRRRLLYGTPSVSLHRGIDAQPGDAAHEAKDDLGDDPLLEAGDIQFEWRG